MTEKQLALPKGMNLYHNSKSDTIKWSYIQVPGWRFIGVVYSMASIGLVLILLNGIARATIGEQPIMNILSIILPGMACQSLPPRSSPR